MSDPPVQWDDTHTIVLVHGRPLPERQLQVMIRIASGWYGDEVARDLGIATKTYDTHRKMLLNALGPGYRRDSCITRAALALGVELLPQPTELRQRTIRRAE